MYKSSGESREIALQGSMRGYTSEGKGMSHGLVQAFKGKVFCLKGPAMPKKLNSV